MASFQKQTGKKDLYLKQQFTENSRRNSTLSTSTQNSFLIEIDNNSDIDETIRSEINTRFNKSIVNATYKFPRISYHPFPSISLQQKFSEENPHKRVFKKFLRSPVKIVSHTPKPSLTKSIKITKKVNKQRMSPSPEAETRTFSITPTPMLFSKKMKKSLDFPKLRNSGGRTPTPVLNKAFRIAYK